VRRKRQQRRHLQPKRLLRLLAQGKSFSEIAKLRERQLGTVVGTSPTWWKPGDLEFEDTWVDAAKRTQIEELALDLGTQWLKPLKEAVSTDITFEEVRL